MADDRPANDDLAAVVAELRRELADLRGTALARAGRNPTGDIEPTIRTTPKPDTLLLQGQTLNRAEYPVLWQWIVDQNLAPSVFGNGNGSTTFVLPDLRGRTVVGATAARTVGTLFGSQTSTLAVANLPSHNHGGTTGSTSQVHTHPFTTDNENTAHQHGFTTEGGGNHSGHRFGNYVVASLGGNGSTLANNIDNNNGHHVHTGGTGGQNAFHRHTGATEPGALGSHTHTIPSQGSGTPLNTEDPGIAVNWLIWT